MRWHTAGRRQRRKRQIVPHIRLRVPATEIKWTEREFWVYGYPARGYRYYGQR